MDKKKTLNKEKIKKLLRIERFLLEEMEEDDSLVWEYIFNFVLRVCLENASLERKKEAVLFIKKNRPEFLTYWLEQEIGQNRKILEKEIKEAFEDIKSKIS